MPLKEFLSWQTQIINMNVLRSIITGVGIALLIYQFATKYEFNKHALQKISKLFIKTVQLQERTPYVDNKTTSKCGNSNCGFHVPLVGLRLIDQENIFNARVSAHESKLLTIIL